MQVCLEKLLSLRGEWKMTWVWEGGGGWGREEGYMERKAWHWDTSRASTDHCQEALVAKWPLNCPPYCLPVKMPITISRSHVSIIQFGMILPVSVLFIPVFFQSRSKHPSMEDVCTRYFLFAPPDPIFNLLHLDACPRRLTWKVHAQWLLWLLFLHWVCR